MGSRLYHGLAHRSSASRDVAAARADARSCYPRCVSDPDDRDRSSASRGALSVVALNELARGLLERGAPRVWVEGEVADVTLGRGAPLLRAR
jgi:hypothetical protein